MIDISALSLRDVEEIGDSAVLEVLREVLASGSDDLEVVAGFKQKMAN